MAESDEEKQVLMGGPDLPDETFVKCARVVERLSQIPRTTIEFACVQEQIDLEQVVGKAMELDVLTEFGDRRSFYGTCIEARQVGFSRVKEKSIGHYVVEVRPWLWFLTRNRNNHIFQELTAQDIVKDIFDRAGFPHYRFDISMEHVVREYCVQYAESDYDFICRLMGEEGVFFYFEHTGGFETLVLADSNSSCEDVRRKEENGKIEFAEREKDYRRKYDHIFEWQFSEHAASDEVSVLDYDFANPAAEQATKSTKSPGKNVIHDYGIYPVSNDLTKSRQNEEHFAKVSLEALSATRKRWQGVANVRTMAAGSVFTLFTDEAATQYTSNAYSGEYLVVSATHLLQNNTDFGKDETIRPVLGTRLADEIKENDNYVCTFEAVPKADPYRVPQTYARPFIPGIQTATVVGPDGEEIHTDKFGRVRVEFHWNAGGPKNETSTLWVRMMQPWTGNAWGVISIPRIGQEVVVQFEQGNPDRPVIVGMMYNNETMPPYELPDNQTMSGIVSRSTKEGTPENFSEFVMEDLKGKEFVRLQSELDYIGIIKNNSVTCVGMDLDPKEPGGKGPMSDAEPVELKPKPEGGNLTQTIWNDKTETLKEGNDLLTIEKGDQTLKIETGSQIIEIETDKTETIKGKSDLTVTGNLTETVKTGNYSHKTSAGKITMEAMQSIELKVGGSSIKIEPATITIKSPVVKIDASGMAEVKSGGLTSVKGSLVMVKGTLTMIN